jgi:hypothetical protein
VPEAQREHSQDGGASAEFVSVFAIEGLGVSARVLGRVVGFASACIAVAFAFPVHDRAFVPESVAVSEYPTAQHQLIIAHGRGSGSDTSAAATSRWSDGDVVGR